MSLTITHTDSDGVITAYLINKYVERSKRIMFSNPSRIKDTILRSLIEEWEIKRLYVLDISGNERALRVASIYDSVVWIDHHEWIPENKYKNIEITIENEPSAARVVSKKYGIEDPIVDFADHLDQNSPQNELEVDFRDLISSIRNSYQREKDHILEKIVFDMMDNDLKTIIDLNKKNIENFRIEMERLKSRIRENIKNIKVNDKNVYIVETDKNIPVYKIQEIVPKDWDLIVVIYKRIRGSYTSWKIEFRSRELDILPVAKLFGGGGHKRAAGANIIYNFEIDQLLRAISIFYK
ncbi:MAG: DHHA1 domain-containing protein [Thermoplasmata archaeon]